MPGGGRHLSDDELWGLYGDSHVQRTVGTPIGGLFTASEGGPAVLLGLVPGDAEKGLTWNLMEHRGHALCFGFTGRGKNSRLITPALLSYGGSAVVLDPKGSSAWATADHRVRMGHRVIVLDPWDEVNRTYGSPFERPIVTHRFNPLVGLDPLAPDFIENAEIIASALVIVTGTEMTPHWITSARDLVTAAIAMAVTRNPGKASLREVREFLTLDEQQLTAGLESIYVIAQRTSSAASFSDS